MEKIKKENRNLIIIAVIGILALTFILPTFRLAPLALEVGNGGGSYSPEPPPPPPPEPIIYPILPDSIYVPPPIIIVENQKPVAEIISATPKTTTLGKGVTLIGRGADADGYITRHNWFSNLDGQISTRNQFTTYTLSEGQHSIVYMVQDDDGAWSDSDLVIIKIEKENVKPTAEIVNPEPDLIFYQGFEQQIQFIGTGDDKDGLITAYEWYIDETFYRQAKFTLSADDLAIGDHVIRFRVKDNRGDWSDIVSITITIGAYDPLIDIPEDEELPPWDEELPPPPDDFPDDPPPPPSDEDIIYSPPYIPEVVEEPDYTLLIILVIILGIVIISIWYVIRLLRKQKII